MCGRAFMHRGNARRPLQASPGISVTDRRRAGPLRQASRGLALIALLGLASGSALAGAREQAKRMHDRLAGVPPTAATLDAMAADISGGNAIDAAYRAMDSAAFYNVTLKNFASPWTNKSQTAFVPLNDYTATVIGMVRDDVPFNTVLSANILYVGKPALGLPPYSMTSNAHYQAMDDQGVDLKDGLVQTTQTAVTSLPTEAVAGVISTRASAEAFFMAGTNRAMTDFTIRNYLCKDLGELKDPSLPVDRIQQDVSRSPGGDSRIYLNACSGCHSGMEPINQAFAYYDWNQAAGRIDYTPGQVQPKYLINSDNFKTGYIVVDDRWDNYWRHGQNRVLGWAASGPGSAGGGHGAASLGAELANSEAFARCQVQKVFRNVCLRDPVNAADRGQVESTVSSFKGSGYKLKRVFAETAAYCKGD